MLTPVRSWFPFVALLSASCSTVPKYSAYDGSYGYWEQELAPGAYQVFAKLPSAVDDLDRDQYLLLRVAELCQKNGDPYFHMAEAVSHVAPAARDEQEVSLVGFCSKKALRPTMNVELGDVGVDVRKVLNPVSSRLREGDVIAEVEGYPVKDLSSLKLAFHRLSPSAKAIRLKVRRAGKDVSIEQPVEQTDMVFGPKDYEALKRTVSSS